MSLKLSFVASIGLLFLLLLLPEGSNANQDRLSDDGGRLDSEDLPLTEDTFVVDDSLRDVSAFDGDLLEDDSVENDFMEDNSNEHVATPTMDAFQETFSEDATESLTSEPVVDSLSDESRVETVVGDSEPSLTFDHSDHHTIEMPSESEDETLDVDDAVPVDDEVLQTTDGEPQNLDLPPPILTKEEELQALRTQLETLQQKNEALEEDLEYYRKHESFVYKLIGGQMIEFVCISIGLFVIMKITDILLMVTDILEEVVIPIVRTGPVYNMQSKKEVSIMF